MRSLCTSAKNVVHFMFTDFINDQVVRRKVIFSRASVILFWFGVVEPGTVDSPPPEPWTVDPHCPLTSDHRLLTWPLPQTNYCWPPDQELLTHVPRPGSVNPPPPQTMNCRSAPSSPDHELLTHPSRPPHSWLGPWSVLPCNVNGRLSCSRNVCSYLDVVWTKNVQTTIFCKFLERCLNSSSGTISMDENLHDWFW